MTGIVLPVNAMSNALAAAADALISQLGESVEYRYHDGGSVNINAVRVKLREDELIGDYKQGDCRINIRPQDIKRAPEKYDKVLGANNTLYTITEYLSAEKSIDDVATHYSVVGRG